MNGIKSKYELGICIHRSPKNSVFKIKNRSNEEIQAIKIIERKNQREAFYHSILINKYIIRYIENFKVNATHIGIVMEYANTDLDKFLKKNGKLSEDQAVIYTKQLCFALHYLHMEIKIVHRDIKCANLLMFDNAKMIKLADFEYCVPLQEPEICCEYCGTIEYMAPELCDMPNIRYNNKVDIWSMGICIYEMLTLTTPFWDVSEDIELIQNNILKKEVKVIDNVSSDCENFVNDLLNKDVLKRPNIVKVIQSQWLD